MKPFLKALLLWASHPATSRNLVATAAFAAILAGLWMERPSLALIVGEAIVFGSLAWSHLAAARERRRQE
jgi:hypothetical protein